MLVFMAPNLWVIHEIINLYISGCDSIQGTDFLEFSWPVKSIKHIFAVHGIPITLISDNGPNYASVEFTDFSHDWDIQHVTSSPHHPKANGKAESAVKIMKSIISKANQ